MYLEIAVGAAMLLGIALYAHYQTRPERLLERFMRSLDVPDHEFRDNLKPVDRLRVAFDVLDDRYLRLCARVRDALYDAEPHGALWRRAWERIAYMQSREPNPEAIEALRDDFLPGLKADADSEEFTELERGLTQLASDLRYFRKLERALASTP